MAKLQAKRGRLGQAAILVFSAIALFFILIAVGVFDPKPVGNLQWERPLSPQTIPSDAETFIWLDALAPKGDFSLRLTAVYQSGELDSAYGLVLGDEDNNFIVAVAPTGYAGIWSDGAALTPFAPFPHVRMNSQPNEIWLDWRGNTATVWLNRELFWEEEIERPSAAIGVWGISWGETAVVDFQTLQLFQEK